VRRTLFAAALAAGAMMMMPAAFAQQSQNPAPPPPSSAPEANPPMQNPMGGGATGQPMPGMRPDAGMPEGMMQRRMMMHRMMALRNPKQACIDRLARRAGLIAYVETKLDLTAQQRPLWDKIQSTANDEAQQERKLCAAIKPPTEETALDRLTRMEQMDSTRLAALKAAIPEVQQLYQQLTPQQRTILDHPFRG
jgi:hypothetical protein